jgi:diaminohydroxyphosphoribosylaminopyrimidine deaminase/5-amino-6-(5-phosphoribosylamino)uracil reductase
MENNMGNSVTTDQQWLDYARTLAEEGRYTCSPNPMVGAVIVAGGACVGEGFHARTGGPHAEILALQAAGARAHGATLYVTLEPCSTHGRTPPCTDALVKAGVARVVVGAIDPNPAHAGRGLDLLREAGIDVVFADHAACRALNERFNHFVTTGRPFVHAKWAMSLDGKIATRTGASRWISGSASRELVHRLRSEYDAVMVGSGTVLADDPRLDVRLDGEWRQPVKVIVDSRCQTPEDAALLSGARTIIACGPAAPEARRDALRRAGAELWELPADSDGVALAVLLHRIGDAGLTGVLVEGGGTLLGSLMAQRLVQRVTVFIGPKLIGGAQAPGPVMGLGAATMADATALTHMQVRRCGADIIVTGRLETSLLGPGLDF